jgi:hypothetical protein
MLKNKTKTLKASHLVVIVIHNNKLLQKSLNVYIYNYFDSKQFQLNNFWSGLRKQLLSLSFFFTVLWWEPVEIRLWELDIGKVRCSSTAFPKMFICRPRLAQPQPQKRTSRVAASLKLFMFREAGTQVSPVIMSCPSQELPLHPV